MCLWSWLFINQNLHGEKYVFHFRYYLHRMDFNIPEIKVNLNTLSGVFVQYNIDICHIFRSKSWKTSLVWTHFVLLGRNVHPFCRQYKGQLFLLWSHVKTLAMYLSLNMRCERKYKSVSYIADNMVKYGFF